MAPFPEDEIMTIKRLEVALRKSDFKLLKEGAYKLHEKYHSHHHFEYTDLLEEILQGIENNYVVPPDIKDILVPTIKDILANNNKNYQDNQQNRVSSLTSLSYGINPSVQYNQTGTEEIKSNNPTDSTKQEESQGYIKPFQEFSLVQPIDMITDTSEQPQQTKPDDSLFSSAEEYNPQPLEDIVTGVPLMQQQNIFENTHQDSEEPVEFLTPKEEFKQEEQFVDNIVEPQKEEKETEQFEEINLEQNNNSINYYKQNELQENTIQNEAQEEVFEETAESTFGQTETINENQQEEVIEEVEEIEEEITEPVKKSILIFLGQDSSNEKIKNIEKYKSFINNKLEVSIYEITNLINEIKIQADTNVSELRMLLEKLKITNHDINLLTNSQSANLIDLFVQNDTTYSIFNPSDDKRVNALPFLGLTNMYKCLECGEKYVDTNEKINSFALQCPKCKGAMLPDLYTTNGEINMDYYNSSIIALANSDTWFLIHPPLDEKLTLNMIRSAAKVSSRVKEIYILDKDINTRETYKKLFEDINSEIKVNTNLSVIEDFFSSI